MTVREGHLQMNVKMTVVLSVLVVGGALAWVAFALFQPAAADTPPTLLAEDVRTALEASLEEPAPKSDKLVTIEVKYGKNVVDLTRKAGATEWTMPGNWPTRSDEVNQLVRLLTGLKSRFVAISIPNEQKAEEYGVDKPAVTVTVKVGDHKQVLKFGTQAASGGTKDGGSGGPENAYYQPTYVRLDDNDKVIRLPPGVVDSLKHPAENYLQRWLFLPPQKQIKEDDSSSPVDRFEVVKAIAMSSKQGDSTTHYTLSWKGNGWELSQPFPDRVDPDRLKTILTAVPDIWVERFVDKPDKDTGLKNPEETLSVTRADGRTVTLLIGKQSRVETRMVMRPSPAPMQPPRPQVVREEFRYAKLQDKKDGSEKIFEIKADKLKDLSAAPNTLRDPRLARFTSADARRLEISGGGRDIVLEKKKDDWRLVKPAEHQADSSKVLELLDKLSTLEARDADLLGKADPKAHGLDKPTATVKVTVEEEKGKGDTKTKKTRTITFHIGKQDKEKAKVYVQVDKWPRVNAVEDGLFNLAQRPALAYRGRTVLDFKVEDLARIEIQRAKDPFTLEQLKNTWRLEKPVQADIDSFLASQLAGDLSRLEAAEFVTGSRKPDDLAKLYGLGKEAALTVRLHFTDKKKPIQTLEVGKQYAGKPEYYARLASAPEVFTIKKETQDTLAKSSLSYRPLQLWQMAPGDIADLRIQKEGPEYHLKRDGQAWNITAPFEASALAPLIKPMTEELANFRAERYEAHFAKDLKPYGLAQPYLRLTVTPTTKEEKKDGKQEDKETKKEDKPEAKKGKEHVLLVGKPVDAKSKARFAKLGDGEAIFVVGEPVLKAVDKEALELLDPHLLSVDAKAVQRIRSTPAGKAQLTLERKGDNWAASGTPAGAFPVDREVVEDLLGVWSNLRALRFAAYRAKTDKTHLAPFGLESPAFTVTLTVQQADKKTKDYTLAVGSLVKDAKGERYARLDERPGIVVLDPAAVRLLTQDYLGYVNRSMLKLDAAAITGLERQMGKDTLELTKQGDAWEITKPAKHPADRPTLDQLVEQLAFLRAEGVAAYPAKDLKPYGLDAPAAVFTVRLKGADKKPAEHILKIGKLHETPETKGNGDRYAVVDKAETVIILPGYLVRGLLAEPLKFRDRTLASLSGVDRVSIQRGSRKAVFARMDGVWKMTEPLAADAEQTDLEDFLKTLNKLRAGELVADKPADLKVYGLDRPQAAWRFYSGGKEILGLLVGAHERVKQGDKEAEGPRAYAKLASSDLVFLLEPQHTTKALGEYRSRTLWAPLDAAQVDQLRYSYRQKPFALLKVENNWQVVGMPTAKIKSETIRDTLDALASLRALRYVDDKGTDAQLYGLKEPQLELTINLPAGKRVLKVGRPEGNSKRYYAQVEGGDTSAVFVIAEADAARILRSLKDFTQAPAK
jgi:hypothetical protein